MLKHILRGRLLASFQDREHKGGDTRSQGGIKDNEIKIKLPDHSMQMISQMNSLEQGSKIQERLKLPQQLSRVHNTFHVSNLKKCLSEEPLAISLDEVHINDKLCFVEEPVKIMDHEVKWLKQILNMSLTGSYFLDFSSSRHHSSIIVTRLLTDVNMSLTDINASLTENNLHQQCKLFSRGNSLTQQWEHSFTSSGKIH
nr:putative reverse transcriptase domain, ribonuclease H-like domain, aspartic peptidase domain protein [Tanacetum cinerariifolium]